VLVLIFHGKRHFSLSFRRLISLRKYFALFFDAEVFGAAAWSDFLAVEYLFEMRRRYVVRLVNLRLWLISIEKLLELLQDILNKMLHALHACQRVAYDVEEFDDYVRW